MNVKKWVFVWLLCVDFLCTCGAVERSRHQPTERISGVVTFIDPFGFFKIDLVFKLFYLRSFVIFP